MSRRELAAFLALLLAAAPSRAQESAPAPPREPDVRRVYPLLREGRWDDLEKELATIAARGRSPGTFEDPLEDVVESLLAVSTIDERSKAWFAARKDSAFARLVRGRFYVRWAWEARGSGWADSVTEEGWKLFRERLEHAKKHLERALELDPKRPHAASELLVVARGLGLEPAAFDRYFAAARKADPGYYEAYSNELTRLMPKWGGSREELLAFARKWAKDEKEPALALLLVEAHIELAARSEDAKAYLDGEGVKDEVDKALKRALDAYPRSIEALQTAKHLAEHRNDQKAYSAALKGLMAGTRRSSASSRCDTSAAITSRRTSRAGSTS